MSEKPANADGDREPTKAVVIDFSHHADEALEVLGAWFGGMNKSTVTNRAVQLYWELERIIREGGEIWATDSTDGLRRIVWETPNRQGRP